MPHDSSNNSIYINTLTNPDQGISIADIQAVTDCERNDIGGLITEGNINKWAKYKPIRYYNYNTTTETKTPYFGELTDEMRKGPQVEQNTGVYYGIKISVGQVTTSTDTWTNLHNSTFEYLRPRGLAQNEAFRFHDYNEYRRNATPNPFASFGEDGEATGFCKREYGILGITVQYLNSNTYGVDLSDILIGTGNKQTILARTYPCILIDGYVTALNYADIADPEPRPLYYNNAYVGGTWIANTNKPVYGALESTDPPWVGPQSGLTATIILVRSGVSNGITIDSTGTQDLDAYWIKCSDALVATRTPVPLPGAVGIDLTLVEWTNGITVYATGVTYNESTGLIYILLSWSGTAAGDGNFTATVSTTLDGSSADTDPHTVSGSTAQPALIGPTYTLLDFGRPHYQAATYTVEVRVNTTDGIVTNTSTERFQLYVP